MNYGFKNENDIIEMLNGKTFDAIPKYFQESLSKIFNYQNEEKFICEKYGGHYKPDIYIKYGNKSINVSIKSGDSVSIHQEILEQFILFLEEIGISKRTIKIIKFYHYGDGTIDGSGKYLFNLGYIKLKYGQFIKEANSELNDNKYYFKIINRLLFSGKYPTAHSMDYLYYGYDSFGFIVSKDNLSKYLFSQKCLYLNCLHIGPFVYQPASRKNKNIKYCQFKWKSITSDIIKITKEYQ